MDNLRFIVNGKSEIKDAMLYVSCTDKTLSGWGYAERKKCKYIYPCDSMKEAEKVAANLGLRGQKYINICCRKPFYRGQLNIVDINPDSWFRKNQTLIAN